MEGKYVNQLDQICVCARACMRMRVTERKRAFSIREMKELKNKGKNE